MDGWPTHGNGWCDAHARQTIRLHDVMWLADTLWCNVDVRVLASGSPENFILFLSGVRSTKT